jgi:serine/threonine protein kinase
MGIYHRDLKPENVLSTHKGARLLIADFGLATLHIKSSAFGSGSCFYMTPGALSPSLLPANPQSFFSYATECLAGYYFPAPIDYSTRAADIWALAIIFINLITARSPWECAIPTDPSFAQYLRNPLWLRQILPISRPAFSFVNRIFFKHGIGITHRELRDRFYSISTFCIPSEELPFASKTAKAIAEECRRTESSAKSDIFSEDDYYEDDYCEDDYCEDDYCEDADKTLVDDTLQDGDATMADDMKHLRLEHSAQLSASSRTSSASCDSDLLITPENAATRPVDIVTDIGGDDDVQDFLLDVEQARHHGLSKQKHKRACVRFASTPEYADIVG